MSSRFAYVNTNLSTTGSPTNKSLTYIWQVAMLYIFPSQCLLLSGLEIFVFHLKLQCPLVPAAFSSTSNGLHYHRPFLDGSSSWKPPIDGPCPAAPPLRDLHLLSLWALPTTRRGLRLPHLASIVFGRPPCFEEYKPHFKVHISYAHNSL